MREEEVRDLEEIKHYYDSVYYSSTPSWNERSLRRHYERLYRRIVSRQGAKVLDVACGTGEWLLVCRDHGCDVSGVDISERAVAECKRSIPSGRFHAQPAESLPFIDGEYDIVTCLGSLEHFVDPQASLREMVRVAKDDATLVFLVPNADFLTRRLGLFGGTDQTAAREVVRTIEEWEVLFVEAGLKVKSRWRDLHVLNTGWIKQGPGYMWPIRAIQALLLAVWPLRWQYQVYFRCGR